MRKEEKRPMKKTSIALPEDLWQRARVAAIERRVEFQQLVAEAIENYLAKAKASKGGSR